MNARTAVGKRTQQNWLGGLPAGERQMHRFILALDDARSRICGICAESAADQEAKR
ncbi:hypothetical protein [Ralstonia solanacearum]|uniref:hypothetical protein n=1 Tax=Ralstonia solanacearum TaxID=305 RepID=UPI0012D4083C|nr:hypothetical protein [Ralstonia solanacearum]MDC6177068.1 hypothetical protein [Ralstonia solanacearum]MDC6238400.1 hypothetical protein [Ralstonia solanacearum]